MMDSNRDDMSSWISRFSISLSLLLFSYVMLAQAPQPAQSRDFSKRTEIDSVSLCIDYKVKLLSFIGKEFYSADLQTLEIGRKYSRFYSRYAEKIDSISTATGRMVRLGKDDEGNTRNGFYEEVFWNYPSAGAVSISSRYLKRDFVYEEPIPEMEWKIISDSTSVILGYDCLSAKCDFRGREWTVWFTPDIPSSLGPWKLNGLPGLILKAADSESCFIYEAVGLQKKTPGAMYIFDSDFEKCSREDVFRFNELRWKDYNYLVQMMSGKQSIVFSQDDSGNATAPDQVAKQIIPQKEKH